MRTSNSMVSDHTIAIRNKFNKIKYYWNLSITLSVFLSAVSATTTNVIGQSFELIFIKCSRLYIEYGKQNIHLTIFDPTFQYIPGACCPYVRHCHQAFVRVYPSIHCSAPLCNLSNSEPWQKTLSSLQEILGALLV